MYSAVERVRYWQKIGFCIYSGYFKAILSPSQFSLLNVSTFVARPIFELSCFDYRRYIWVASSIQEKMVSGYPNVTTVFVLVLSSCLRICNFKCPPMDWLCSDWMISPFVFLRRDSWSSNSCPISSYSQRIF